MDTPTELSRCRDSYPSPLAMVAGDLLHALAAARLDHRQCFHLEIDLFESSVALLAFAQIAQLEALDLPPRSSRTDLARLRSGADMCTGHWWALLKNTSQDVLQASDERLSPASSAIARLYFDKAGGTSPMGALLDQVPGLRNRVKGHSWTLRDDQYEKAAEDAIGTLVRYLGCLAWMGQTCLLHVLDCVQEPDGSWLVDGEDLRGNTRRPNRAVLRATTPLQRGHVYLTDTQAFAARLIAPDSALDLDPFVRISSPLGIPELLQGLKAGKVPEAVMMSVVGGESRRCNGSGQRAADRMDRILARVHRSEMDALRGGLAAACRDALSSPLAATVYRPGFYLARECLLQIRSDILAGDQRLACLVAPSGLGKTAFICFLADTWLVTGAGGGLVSLAFAQDLLADRGSPRAWLERQLGMGLERAAGICSADGAMLLVLVDGIDLLPNSVQHLLLTELLQLATTPSLGALRFLITGTEPWIGAFVESASRIAPRGLRRLVIPALDRAEAGDLFRLLATAENASAAAVPEHLLDTLTSPLLVTLAHSMTADSASTAVSPGRVFLSFVEQTVYRDLARSEIVEALLVRILETREKVVALSALMRDPWMRAVVVSGGPDSPVAALVRDQILLLERRTSDGTVPMPAEPTVRFAFDQLLEFLLVVKLVRAHGADADGFARLAREIGPFAPLVGAYRFLCTEWLLHEPEQALPGSERPVVRLLASLEADFRDALLAELFTALIPIDCRSPLGHVARELFPLLDDPGQRGLIEAASCAFARHEARGQPGQAMELAGLAVGLGQDRHLVVVLPLALRWGELTARCRSSEDAVALARRFVAMAEQAGEESLRTEALALLLDCVEKVGRPDEADTVLEQLLDAKVSGSLSPAAVFECAAAEVKSFRRLGDHDRKQKALRLMMQTALESQDPRWIARAHIHELGSALSSRIRSTGADASALDHLVEETLRAAQASGNPRHEAEAYRLAAWRWQSDPLRESELLDRGLRAAKLASNPTSRARLLSQQATLYLRTGRFDEAWQSASSAADLFRQLGHTYDHLRTMQHKIALLHNEAGRPGDAARALDRCLEGLTAISDHSEAALAALLLALLHCEAGDPASARKYLERQADARLAMPKGRPLNTDLVLGWILELEGDADQAKSLYERAMAWGLQAGFPDYIFQPAIRLARIHVQAWPPSEERARAAQDVLRSIAQQTTSHPTHRERYDGEISVLHARAHLDSRNLGDARLWIDQAIAWFKPRSQHQAKPEADAAQCVHLWLEAEMGLSAVQGPLPRGKRPPTDAGAEKKKLNAKKRAQELVMPAVVGFASTFDNPAHRRGFVVNHPAVRLLRRFDVLSDEEVANTLLARADAPYLA